MKYDCTINGLSVGPLQDITISKMDGLTGSPPVRETLIDRLGADGSFYGRDTYGPRTVTLTLNLWPNRTGSGSTLDGLTQQLETALVRQQQGSLQMILNGGTRLINLRPTVWDMPRTTDMANERWGKATAQFVAADPLIYDAVETILSLPVYVPAATGWTFPWTFGWMFAPIGQGSGGTVLGVNNGSIETGPWFRVVGPYDVGFQLQNLTTGATLGVNLVLRATDWVDIDMSAETILFQSISSRRSSVQFGTDFWKLPPGTSTVRLVSLGAQAGTNAQMHYRSAYVALRG